MKVYVLTVDQVYDFECCELVVETFSNKADALRRLLWYTEDDKKNNAIPNEWRIDEDIDKMFYVSYEDGRYSENHYEAIVHECELQ